MRRAFFAGWFTALVLLSSCSPGAKPAALPAHRNADEIARIREAWARAGSPPEFTFVVLGDNRDGEAVHRRLLEQVKAEAGALFVVNTGDLVDEGDPAEYVRLVRDLERYGGAYLVVPGNHDHRHDGPRHYREVFGAPDWAFDLGACRFVGLDNHSGGFSDVQLEWLDRMLDTEKRCFVFMHMPPPLGRWGAHAFVHTSERLLAVIRRRRPERVFCGHIHGHGRQEAEGTTWVVTGGAGAPMDGVHQVSGVETVFHYVRVRTGPAGTVDEKVNLRR